MDEKDIKKAALEKLAESAKEAHMRKMRDLLGIEEDKAPEVKPAAAPSIPAVSDAEGNDKADFSREKMLQAGVPLPGAGIATAGENSAVGFFDALRRTKQLKDAEAMVTSGGGTIKSFHIPKLTK